MLRIVFAALLLATLTGCATSTPVERASIVRVAEIQAYLYDDAERLLGPSYIEHGRTTSGVSNFTYVPKGQDDDNWTEVVSVVIGEMGPNLYKKGLIEMGKDRESVIPKVVVKDKKVFNTKYGPATYKNSTVSLSGLAIVEDEVSFVWPYDPKNNIVVRISFTSRQDVLTKEEISAFKAIVEKYKKNIR